MLVFNEGLPRSGKSYDAVVSHILPALKSGRKVYARLNGLGDASKRAAIADYLGVDSKRLDALLVHVPTSSVVDTFVAVLDGDGEWVIPQHMQDALFVIDEAHDFYVSSRQPMPREVENFFALHGQNGMDGVVMTQWFRRLHSSVRARIERKNVFQKLTAVGMKGSYKVRRYHASAPERYELVEAETKRYDPAIFPLYKGYADGSRSKDVYTAGGTTVWRRLRRLAFVVVPVLLIAVWQLWRFLFGGSAEDFGLQPSKSVSTSARRASAAPADVLPTPRLEKPAPRRDEMPPAVAYVWRLSDQVRPRLEAVLRSSRGVAGVVAWPEDRQTVLDRLTFAQLRDMGVVVRVESYGAVLAWRDRTMVVTAWPMPEPLPVAPAGQGTETAAPAPQRPSVAGLSGPPRGWGTDLADPYVPPEWVPRPGGVDRTRLGSP